MIKGSIQEEDITMVNIAGVQDCQPVTFFLRIFLKNLFIY